MGSSRRSVVVVAVGSSRTSSCEGSCSVVVVAAKVAFLFGTRRITIRLLRGGGSGLVEGLAGLMRVKPPLWSAPAMAAATAGLVEEDGRVKPPLLSAPAAPAAPAAMAGLAAFSLQRGGSAPGGGSFGRSSTPGGGRTGEKRAGITFPRLGSAPGGCRITIAARWGQAAARRGAGTAGAKG